MTTRADGQWGEALTAEFLRRRGYRILAASFRCRFGEIDLIAQTGETICFVEVKTRTNTSVALPREYVTRSKQEKIKMTAAYYLSTVNGCPRARFDVAEVYTDALRKAENTGIRYLENAFE